MIERLGRKIAIATMTAGLGLGAAACGDVNVTVKANRPGTSTTIGSSAENQSGQKKTEGGRTMPEALKTVMHGKWEVSEFKGLSDNPIVEGWLNRLKTPAPELWPTFPNVTNPKVSDFDVKNGVEYGMADSPFGETDQRADFVVPAREYRLITGDYTFLGKECKSSEGHGCLLLLVNVGDSSYTWRNQKVDNGFTVHGRYWNGDKLEEAVQGVVSHASANMLNMPTSAHPGESLNFGSVGANAGANCGKAKGCNQVEATVVVHAGDQLLAMARTTVAR